MLAFEILLNGQRRCIAGTEMSDVLAFGLSWVRRESGAISLNLGGIVAGKNEHFGWDMPAPGIGDELTIRLIEVEKYDTPDFFHPVEPHPESVNSPPATQS